MKKLALSILIICCLFTACAAVGEEAGTVSVTDFETMPETICETVSETTSDTVPVAAAVVPLPVTIDVNRLDSCTVAVSLKEGDVYVDDTGTVQMKVTVYAYDLYDMVDIALLEVGGTILIRQQDVVITALERSGTGAVLINGGLDHGGYELRTDEDGVFYEIGYSDVKSWYEIGEATISISPDFAYTDSSDLDRGDATYDSGDFLTEDTGIDYGFTPYNTSIVIEDGLVIAMNRVYTP